MSNEENAVITNESPAERLAAIKKEITDLKEAAKLKAREVFDAEMKRLFQGIGELISITWTQYTPYFNDGDTCTFSSHHCDFGWTGEIEGQEIEVPIYESAKYAVELSGVDEETHDRIMARAKAIENEVGSILRVFDDDDMENLFGDHAEVTVTVDGSSSDYYEHD